MTSYNFVKQDDEYKLSPNFSYNVNKVFIFFNMFKEKKLLQNKIVDP